MDDNINNTYYLVTVFSLHGLNSAETDGKLGKSTGGHSCRLVILLTRLRKTTDTRRITTLQNEIVERYHHSQAVNCSGCSDIVGFCGELKGCVTK
jgi:hypothetical protein